MLGRSLWRSIGVIILLLFIGVIVAFPGFVLDGLLPDQTLYSDSFSEEAFSRVKPGMRESEVLEILGKPLSVSEHVGSRVYETSWTEGPSTVVGVQFRWWAYSKRGRLSDSYNVRAIKFSPEGKVLEVLNRYYAD
jgi:outer membrane protein assembly factor BamE (lipoprotein component of BamABCDE complex)